MFDLVKKVTGARPPNPSLVMDLSYLRIAEKDWVRLEILYNAINRKLFLTPKGLFKLLVIFFGLTNSLATFYTIINTKFYPKVKKRVFSDYIDDYVIHIQCPLFKMKKQHLLYHQMIVYEIIDKLAALDLYLKLE